MQFLGCGKASVFGDRFSVCELEFLGGRWLFEVVLFKSREVGAYARTVPDDREMLATSAALRAMVSVMRPGA
ncbi:hypothetical protein, partial [Pandoraea nosoerga]|uniref:hypothetical protein n=1 Tax=Pandoraea nosoerga TaxID=2508296 RepID=UPI00197DCCA8